MRLASIVVLGTVVGCSGGLVACVGNVGSDGSSTRGAQSVDDDRFAACAAEDDPSSDPACNDTYDDTSGSAASAAHSHADDLGHDCSEGASLGHRGAAVPAIPNDKPFANDTGYLINHSL